MDSKAGANKSNKTRFIFFVEGGTFTMGKVDDVMHDWNNAPTQSFDG
jgi:hypothetical protein